MQQSGGSAGYCPLLVMAANSRQAVELVAGGG